MSISLEELQTAALDSVEAVFSPHMAAAGLTLRAKSCGASVASALFAGTEFGVLVGLDYHDSYLYVHFVRAGASLDSVKSLLEGSITLEEVIRTARHPTARRDLKTVQRSTNPYDQGVLKKRLRELDPILLRHLIDGGKFVAHT